MKPFLNSPTLGQYTWNSTNLPVVRNYGGEYLVVRMVEEMLFSAFDRWFSKEVLACANVPTFNLKQEETKLLNIDHGKCRHYTTDDAIAYVHDVQKMLDFLTTCYNMLILYKPFNNLFGFVKINTVNCVPFVWWNQKQLVPLFYFDGQVEYLENRAICISDNWLLTYFKLCFKVQKIDKSYYSSAQLDVVDLADVIMLFPPGTSVEIGFPDQINPELFKNLAVNIKINQNLSNPPPISKKSPPLYTHRQLPKKNESKIVTLAGKHFLCLKFANYWLISAIGLLALFPCQTKEIFSNLKPLGWQFISLSQTQRDHFDELSKSREICGKATDVFLMFTNLNKLKRFFKGA